MALKYLNAQELEKWKAQNPGRSYYDASGNQVAAPTQSTTKNLGFFGNLLRSASKPFRMGGGVAQELGYTIADLARMAQGKEQLERPQKYLGLTEEESTALATDPFREGLKSSAGILSYAVPAGAAKGAATLGGRIGTAAARGAGAGALGGLGLSETGQELESVLKGGALGGLLGGTLQGVGEAASRIKGPKISNKLTDMADDLKTTAYKKKIGLAPTAKQGKYDLVRDSMKLANSEGRKIVSADDLYQFSDEVFAKYGDTANSMAQMADDMGTVVTTDKLIKPLQEKMKTLRFPEDKVAYQNVIDQIKGATGGAKNIKVSDLLDLRRQIGPKGNWNQLTPTAEQTTAKIWEEVYSIANKTLDDTLSKVGIGGFKEVNKKLATAIEQQNWARRAIASRSGQQVWTDMAQDAVMFGTALGSGPGGIAGFATSKLLQGQGENIAAGALELGSKIASAAPAVGRVISGATQVGQRAIPAISALGLGQTAQPEQPEQIQPEMEYPMQEQQTPQFNQMALVDAVLSGQLSITEANWIMDMLGGGAGQQALPKTDSGRKAMVARDAAVKAINLLEQDPNAAGKLQGIENIFYDITGQANTATQYQTLLEGLRSQVFNALGGTSLTPTEKKQYEKFLPKITDSPRQAQQKLTALIPMMESLMGTEIDTQLDEDNTSSITRLLGL